MAMLLRMMAWRRQGENVVTGHLVCEQIVGTFTVTTKTGAFFFILSHCDSFVVQSHNFFAFKSETADGMSVAATAAIVEQAAALTV